MRTQEQMYEAIDRVFPWVGRGATKFRGMTYEQGVVDALSWVLGDVEEDPTSEYVEDEE